MVSLLSISDLSYSENPRNTRNQCEESRKVWGQYIHEHGNVIQNICKKSEETKRKVKKHIKLDKLLETRCCSIMHTSTF